MSDTIHRFKAAKIDGAGVEWSSALWPRPVALMLKRLRIGTVTWPSQVAEEMDNYEAEYRAFNADWAILAPWCRGRIGMDPEGFIGPYAIAAAFREQIIRIRRDNLQSLAEMRGWTVEALPSELLSDEVLGDSSDVEPEVLHHAAELVYAHLVIYWTRSLEARADRDIGMRSIMDARMDLEAAEFREIFTEMDGSLRAADMAALRADTAAKREAYSQMIDLRP